MRYLTALLLVSALIHPSRSAAQQPTVDFELPPSGKVVVPAKGGVQFDALINGKGPFRLIFDSGAGVSILAPTVARQVGLIEDGTAMNLTGAGSGSVLTPGSNVKSLQVGDLVLHDQRFYIMPMPWGNHPGPVGAVGFEFMRRLIVTVDYQREQLGAFGL